MGTVVPRTMPAVEGIGQVSELLGHHISRFQVGNHQDFRMAGHRRADALGLGGDDGDRVVEGQRAIQDAALICRGRPSCTGRRHPGVDWILGLTVSTAERMATLGWECDDVGEVDGVLDDVHLLFQRRGDVDCRVGDEQRPMIGGDVHDEDVADAARGPQAVGAGDHFAHQFVGVEAAFHQGFGVAIAHQRYGNGRGIVAVLGIDDADAAEVEAVFFRHRPYLGFGPTRMGSMMPS